VLIAKVAATILAGQTLPVQYAKAQAWLALLNLLKYAAIAGELAQNQAINFLV